MARVARVTRRRAATRTLRPPGRGLTPGRLQYQSHRLDGGITTTRHLIFNLFAVATRSQSPRAHLLSALSISSSRNPWERAKSRKSALAVDSEGTLKEFHVFSISEAMPVARHLSPFRNDPIFSRHNPDVLPGDIREINRGTPSEAAFTVLKGGHSIANP